MAPFDPECPSPATLDAIAHGAPPPPEVAAHIARCRRCVERLDNARFTQRFAAVLGDSPVTNPTNGPATSRTLQPDARSHAPLRAPLPEVPGYTLLREVSRGGQGIVYEARQTTTGQRVAIKILNPAGAASPRSARARFLREIQIVASLHHPGIVAPIDALSLIDGSEALIMEFIEGHPLDEWARAAQPERRQRLELLADVSDALHHAHQKGVIHRDLKPSNILIDTDTRPRLLDFGVARRFDSSDTPSPAERITRTGEFTGTLAYAAPEQVGRETTAPDVRTDVYALGVIGFELLTGRLPYTVDGSLETAITNIVSAPTPNPTSAGLELDTWTVIAKAMSKEPDRRYQSAADLARDLRHAARGEAIDARRDSRWYMLRKAARRHRLAVTAALVIITSLAAIAGILARSNTRLSGALRESTLRQIHAHTAADARARAEELLWPMLDASLPRSADPAAALYGGEADTRELLWAFIELQARATCARVAPPLPAGSRPTSLTPLESGEFGIVTADRHIAILDPRTAQLTIGAALPPDIANGWFTPNGRLVITLAPDRIDCVDAASGRVLATRGRGSNAAGLSGVPLSNTRAAISSAEGGVDILSLPDLSLRTHRSGPAKEQRIWLDPDSDRFAFVAADGRLMLGQDGDGSTDSPLNITIPATDPGTYPQILFDPRTDAMTVVHGGGVLTARLNNGPPRPLPNAGYRMHIALSPDGAMLAARAFGDSSVRLWRTDTWQELTPLPGHTGAVSHHAFSADGGALITADIAGVVRIWSVPGRGWRTAIGPPTGRIHDFAVVPSALPIAPDADGVATIYYKNGAEPLGSPVQPIIAPPVIPDPPRILAHRVVYSEAAQMVVCLATDDSVTLVDPGSNVRTQRFPGEVIIAAAFNAAGTHLTLCTQSGRLITVDLSTDAPIADAKLPDRSVPSAMVAIGDQVAVTLRGGSIVFAEIRHPHRQRSIAASTAQLRNLAAADRMLAAVGDDGRIIILDSPTSTPRASQRISEDSLFAVAIHPTRAVIAAGDRAGRIVFLDTATLRPLATINAGSAIMAMHFADDGDSLYIAALDRPLERWDLASLARTLPEIRPGK